MQDGMARVVQELTNDHEQAAKALRLPLGSRGVNASPYFSVSDLIKRWPVTSARREVFVASDGIDLYYGSGSMDNPYVDAAVEDAQKTGTVVYGIYTPGMGHMGHSRWLTNWGQMYLAQLAEQTGGEAYYIGFEGPAVSFSPYLNEISEHFAHQYLLTFVPKPQKKAGMQKVKIRTEVPKVDLTAADQVYVPKGK
jgi:hypothetical protein